MNDRPILIPASKENHATQRNHHERSHERHCQQNHGGKFWARGKRGWQAGNNTVAQGNTHRAPKGQRASI